VVKVGGRDKSKTNDDNVEEKDGRMKDGWHLLHALSCTHRMCVCVGASHCIRWLVPPAAAPRQCQSWCSR